MDLVLCLRIETLSLHGCSEFGYCGRSVNEISDYPHIIKEIHYKAQGV